VLLQSIAIIVHYHQACTFQHRATQCTKPRAQHKLTSSLTVLNIHS